MARGFLFFSSRIGKERGRGFERRERGPGEGRDFCVGFGGVKRGGALN